GYHLVNVLLHALNAVLLWRLLRRLGLPAAWLAAAVFAVHPVHVQSVAWISELKNVLSTAFFLSSMLLLVRYLGLVASRSPAGWVTYGLGVALFVCALLSKTATCLLPAALLLVVWWKRGRVDRRSLLAVAPLVVLGAAFVLMTV
ncbi:MAG: tetratricopeptide repeat protein, partial [Planctomycetota bacterium]